MWKKITIVFVGMIYALVSTGAIIHLDYCCGKLSKVSLARVENEKHGCSKDKMEPKSCCDSKQVHLTVKGEQELLQKEINSTFNALPPLTVQEVNLFFVPMKNVNTSSNGPPLIFSSQPLFIQHCIFRI